MRVAPAGTDLRAPEAHGKVAERPRREQARVDVGNRLAPAIEEVDRVVAPLDLRHAHDRATAFVDCDPGFGVSHVEIRVGPIHGTRFAVHEFVPLESLFEVDLLLPRYQQATEQVDIRIADVLIRDARRLRLRDRRCRKNESECHQGRLVHDEASAPRFVERRPRPGIAARPIIASPHCWPVPVVPSMRLSGGGFQRPSSATCRGA